MSENRIRSGGNNVDWVRVRVLEVVQWRQNVGKERTIRHIMVALRNWLRYKFLPVKFNREGLGVTTICLTKEGHPEIHVEVDSATLIDDAEQFLRFVVAYIRHSGVTIKAGESLQYGYWSVKFESRNDSVLEVWEYNQDATAFVLGASLAVRYWHEQNCMCLAFHARFDPPVFSQATVISAGVIEGLPVEGVRYPWGERMSGWLLVTKEWDGRMESLQRHHTYHVTAARPELAQYLALPRGFRFDLTQGERVWFDAEAAKEQYPPTED